ncbi:MAG: YifB family Mg chelatase-like AAA ATPase [Treponema sp.]|jgi:magnesium chelatase family protein|nr:YifB family Mg chelatase-like AAA ATPase [Treponema sp.]
MTIYSFSPFGYEGALVTVEVDLRRGIPAIDMVGLADGAVRESRERMRVAVQNSGFDFPLERILISLSPADVRKEGAGFDLPIALAVLAASLEEQIPENRTVLVMGELELSGKVRPVRGVHAAVVSALEQGIHRCIVPAANAAEAKIQNMRVCSAETLSAAFEGLIAPFDSSLESPQETVSVSPEETKVVEFPEVSPALEFAEIKRQDSLVRALQIAAAGAHNLLAYGPPGCGKTLALSRFPALLPLLDDAEARPVTRIYSLAGDLPQGQPLMRIPPFRTPHQSSSLEGMIGGGKNCSPGEVSLAHNGVLFLDEAAEFKTHVLQSLRVPLESGFVTVSRAGRKSEYPAAFQLIAASNPCPCGNFGVRGKICLCSARSVEQYWTRFSAPLLDRIDIRIPVFPQDDSDPSNSGTTGQLREAIGRAVGIQRRRQQKRNRFLLPEEIRKYCVTDNEADQTLSDAAMEYGFSARGVASCLKLGRTIADMAGRTKINKEDIKEAVSLRKNEGGLSYNF